MAFLRPKVFIAGVLESTRGGRRTGGKGEERGERETAGDFLFGIGLFFILFSR